MRSISTRTRFCLAAPCLCRQVGSNGQYNVAVECFLFCARRSWARNENALTTAAEYNKLYEGQDHITLPYVADDAVVESAVKTMKG